MTTGSCGVGTIQALYDEPGEYHAHVQVLEKNGVRYLRFGQLGGWQGVYDTKHPQRIIFPYQRAFSSLVASLEGIGRYLSFGVGTGTSLRTVFEYHEQCNLNGVELDEKVLDVAIHYFGSPSHTQANYWVGDGIQYLRRFNALFDLIFVDAYLSNRVYSPCLDPEFAILLSESLTKQGVAACNIISEYPFVGRARDFIDSATSVFPSVLVLPVGLPVGEQNLLVVFSKIPELEIAWRKEIRSHERLSLWQRSTWPLRLRRLDGSQSSDYN